MRITNTILYNSTLANIQQYSARLLQANEEAASGRRLHRPSDDPAGTRRVLDLRGALSSLGTDAAGRRVARPYLLIEDAERCRVRCGEQDGMHP